MNTEKQPNPQAAQLFEATVKNSDLLRQAAAKTRSDLAGEGYPLTFREIVNIEAKNQRAQGAKFKPQVITEAARLLEAHATSEFLKLARAQWDQSQSIGVFCRRWFDKVNGNSYFSLSFCFYISSDDYSKWITINQPMSYGYGSHPEFEAYRKLHGWGFLTDEQHKERQKVRFIDNGYGLKRDLYQGRYL